MKSLQLALCLVALLTGAAAQSTLTDPRSSAESPAKAPAGSPARWGVWCERGRTIYQDQHHHLVREQRARARHLQRRHQPHRER